jgi:hypothetical protein
MSELEYACWWIVRDGYELTDEQLEELLPWLDSIPGAIQECSAWSSEGKVPSTNGNDMRSSKYMLVRGGWLLEALLKLEIPTIASCFDEGGHIVKVHPVRLLKRVVKQTFKGKKPEIKKIPEMFPGDERFLKDYLWPLYRNSLQLRGSDVRAYCAKNGIKQKHDIDGLWSNDSPPSQQLSAESSEEKAREKPPKRSTGSNKDKPRIEATKKACEQVRQEIAQKAGREISLEGPMFLVNGVAKTNQDRFEQVVHAILGKTKPHRDTLREEWKKVPKELVHNGRPPEQ